MICSSGKVGYRSRGEARLVVARIQAGIPSGERRPRSVYRCPECRTYHMTHQAQQTRRRLHGDPD